MAGKEHDFNIQDQRYLDTLGAPYDYGSIMHYGPYIFSKDPNRPAMTPKYDPRVEMGQRNGFSKLDIWKINTLYGCKSGNVTVLHVFSSPVYFRFEQPLYSENALVWNFEAIMKFVSVN